MAIDTIEFPTKRRGIPRFRLLLMTYKCDSSSVDQKATKPLASFMDAHSNIVVRFGQRVRELRKKRGLSQETFAAECGLDRTYISGIERGKRNVSLLNIEVLAKSFGVSIAELMKEL
jgi:ribosome-binding protein aMBF1 (putative translation factor)